MSSRGNVSRYKDLGPLQDLLLEACPPAENGDRSIVILAGKLGISYQYIYRWISEGRVPPKYVDKLVTLSEGRLDFTDFHRYVFVG